MNHSRFVQALSLTLKLPFVIPQMTFKHYSDYIDHINLEDLFDLSLHIPLRQIFKASNSIFNDQPLGI